MLPETMTVIEAKGHGRPEVLMPGRRAPCSAPGAGEVLIEVKAAGINRPDVLQRQGLYPPPKGASDLLGLEVAGTWWHSARRDAVQGRRRRVRADQWRRLCRVLRGAGRHDAPSAGMGCRSSRPPRCPRPYSPCGTTCSSAGASSPANGCSSMAVRAASARPPSRWDGSSAPR